MTSRSVISPTSSTLILRSFSFFSPPRDRSKGKNSEKNTINYIKTDKEKSTLFCLASDCPMSYLTEEGTKNAGWGTKTGDR